MSEQRKMRSELKQGLHQFTMSLYKSYRQSMAHEEAKDEIVKCLEEELAYFKEPSTETPQTLELLSLDPYINHLMKLAKAEKEMDKQYEFYNDLEMLVSAKELLPKYTPTRK